MELTKGNLLVHVLAEYPGCVAGRVEAHSQLDRYDLSGTGQVVRVSEKTPQLPSGGGLAVIVSEPEILAQLEEGELRDLERRYLERRGQADDARHNLDDVDEELARVESDTAEAGAPLDPLHEPGPEAADVEASLAKALGRLDPPEDTPAPAEG